jgi:hypothetical protein
VVKLDTSALHRCLSHRAVRSSAALRGTTGIEDLETVARLVQWHVGMPEDDRVRFGKAGSKTIETALRGAGVVDHTQDYVLELQGDRLGQLAAELSTVDVAVDRGHGPELTQVGEHRWVAEIAGVDDQVGASKGVEARL